MKAQITAGRGRYDGPFPVAVFKPLIRNRSDRDEKADIHKTHNAVRKGVDDDFMEKP